MKKRARIIMGTLLLLLAFGIVYSIHTAKTTEADCLRHYVTCTYLEYDHFCLPCYKAWVTYRFFLCVGDACPTLPSGPYPPGGDTVTVEWWFSVEGYYYETWPLPYSPIMNEGHIRFHIAEAGSWGGGFGFLNGDGTWLRDYQLMGYYTNFWTQWFDESGPNAVKFIRVYGSTIGGANVRFDEYEYNYPGGNTCLRSSGRCVEVSRTCACANSNWPNAQKPSEFQEAQPQNFSLFQNYPNPFNPETEISYDLPHDGWVKLSIYNVKGEKVTALVDKWEATGHKTVIWDGTNENGGKVVSGIYFYKLEAEDFTATKKMVLLR
jgi:hypothetical protein